ncbi:MAG: beta strand repeat-containing protein, partial [Rhodoferax sp.]
AIKIVSTTRVENGASISDISIGLDGVSGSLGLGSVGATLTNGRGAILLRNEVSATGVVTQRYAVQVTGAVGLTGVSGVTLSATNLTVGVNRWGAAVGASVATPGNDYTVSLLKDECRIRGQVSAVFANLLQLSGEMFIESRVNQSVVLSDGSKVLTNQLFIGGSGIEASITAAGSGLTTALHHIDIAAVLSNEIVASGTARRWLTSNAVLGGVSAAGYVVDDLTSASIDINRALDSATGALGAADAAVVNWANSAATVQLSDLKSVAFSVAGPRFNLPVSGSLNLGGAMVSGDFTVSLDQVGNDKVWTITASNASVGFTAGGAYVGIERASGSLLIGPGTTRSGAFTGSALLDGLSGVSASGNFSTAFDASGAITFTGSGVALSIGSFGSLQGNFSVTRGADQSVLIGATNVSASLGSGIAVSGASMGLYVAGLTQTSAGYALVASGTALLSGFTGVSLSAAASIRINTLGRSINTTVAGVAIEFADRTRIEELAISSGTLSVAGLGSLSGALAVISETSSVNGVTVYTLRIGLSGVGGSLSIGGLGATLTGGSGAVLLKKVGNAAGTYAVQVEGSLALTGVNGITLTASSMKVGYNRMGAAVVNEVVATGAGSYTVNLVDNETRIRGTAHAAVAGLSIDGDIFLEGRTAQSSTLSDASTVSVDQLILGGAGLTAAFSANNQTLASLGSADLALAICTERVASGTARRWLTGVGNLGSASIFGYQLADLTAAGLNINQAIDASGNLIETAGTAVINWSGANARTLALSATDAAKTAVLNLADQRFV